MAAVGNGGTLYRPQVVEMIASDPTHPDLTFQPAVVGQLPVSAENLAIIQDSLAKVTSAEYGTAYEAFKGLSLTVAGKTGTAESGQNLPHAWFAGYAPANDPEIAIAVIVENSGEGATYAAPLFRQVVEAYFAELLNRFSLELSRGVPFITCSMRPKSTVFCTGAKLISLMTSPTRSPASAPVPPSSRRTRRASSSRSDRRASSSGKVCASSTSGRGTTCMSSRSRRPSPRTSCSSRRRISC